MVTVQEEVSNIQKEILAVNNLLLIFQGDVPKKLEADTARLITYMMNEMDRNKYDFVPLYIPESQLEKEYAIAGSLNGPLQSLHRHLETIKVDLNHILQAVDKALSETNGIGNVDKRIVNEINAFWGAKLVGSIRSIIDQERKCITKSAGQVKQLHEMLEHLKKEIEAEIESINQFNASLMEYVRKIVDIRDHSHFQLGGGTNYRIATFPQEAARNAIILLNREYDLAVQ